MRCSFRQTALSASHTIHVRVGLLHNPRDTCHQRWKHILYKHKQTRCTGNLNHLYTHCRTDSCRSRTRALHQQAAAAREPLTYTQPDLFCSSPAKALTDLLSLLTTPHRDFAVVSSVLLHILKHYAASLSIAQYTLLITLAYRRGSPPHILVLTLYRSFLNNHSIRSGTIHMYQAVAPVLLLHEDYAAVISIYHDIQSRQLEMNSPLLGMILHAVSHTMNERERGKLALMIYNAYQHNTHLMKLATKTALLKCKDSLRPNAATASVSPPVSADTPPTSRHTALSRVSANSFTSPFNLVHFTLFIRALHQSQFSHYAVFFLQEMHRHHIQPDEFVYHSILTVLCAKYLWVECVYVLDDMIKHDIKPTTQAYYYVLLACAYHGEWNRVMAMIGEMQTIHHLPLNEDIYEVAILACEYAQRYTTSKEILTDMIHKDIRMTYDCYYSLIRQASRLKQWKTVLMLFDSVKDLSDYKQDGYVNDQVLIALYKIHTQQQQHQPKQPNILTQNSSRTATAARPAAVWEWTPRQLFDVYFSNPPVLSAAGFRLLVSEDLKQTRLLGDRAGTEEARARIMTAIIQATQPTRSGFVGGFACTTVRPGINSITLTKKYRKRQQQQQHEQQSNRHGLSTWQRPPASARHIRVSLHPAHYQEALATVDLLLMAMYYHAMHEELPSITSAVKPEEIKQWNEMLLQLPSVWDTVAFVCGKSPTIVQKEIEEEQALRQQWMTRNQQLTSGSASSSSSSSNSSSADDSRASIGKSHLQSQSSSAVIRDSQIGGILSLCSNTPVSHLDSSASSFPSPPLPSLSPLEPPPLLEFVGQALYQQWVKMKEMIRQIVKGTGITRQSTWEKTIQEQFKQQQQQQQQQLAEPHEQQQQASTTVAAHTRDDQQNNKASPVVAVNVSLDARFPTTVSTTEFVSDAAGVASTPRVTVSEQQQFCQSLCSYLLHQYGIVSTPNPRKPHQLHLCEAQLRKWVRQERAYRLGQAVAVPQQQDTVTENNMRKQRQDVRQREEKRAQREPSAMASSSTERSNLFAQPMAEQRRTPIRMQHKRKPAKQQQRALSTGLPVHAGIFQTTRPV